MVTQLAFRGTEERFLSLKGSEPRWDNAFWGQDKMGPKIKKSWLSFWYYALKKSWLSFRYDAFKKVLTKTRPSLVWSRIILFSPDSDPFRLVKAGDKSRVNAKNQNHIFIFFLGDDSSSATFRRQDFCLFGRRASKKTLSSKMQGFPREHRKSRKDGTNIFRRGQGFSSRSRP